jgi:hypothetical protein
VVAALVTLVLRPMRIAGGTDETTPSDYFPVESPGYSQMREHLQAHP